MRTTIKAYISHGETHYVAECLEIGVVTQGKTLDETIANLKEAVALFLEGEDPADYDLVPSPSLLITMEVEPLAHVG
ncbi:MAG TPA: type II toxin-antitoxin system HicB family antitoxin [bacterium]|nr:type II toxin-antitoxin system HicB family antitoxin [bacterium]